MDALTLLQQLQRPDLEDLDETDHIIDWVSAFTADTEFLTCVDEFTQRYASEFKSEGKDEGEDGSAFTLRHTELYNEFVKLTEGKIEEFLASKGFDSKTFYRLCKQEVARAEHQRRNTTRSFFVQLLLAGSEFQAFAAMMRASASAVADALERLQQTAIELATLVDESKEEGDSVTVVLTDEEREVLRSESAAARQWLEEHPSATLAEVTARECRVDDAVGAILIKATMAARKK